MRLAAYLSQSRHRVFYFRWPIPARLHPERKRSHVRFSLRTRCPATAKRLSRVLVLAGQSQIVAASASAMRYDEIRGQVAQHFQEQLARFKAGVMENGPPDEDRQVLMQNIRARLGRDWSSHAVQIGVDQAAQQVQVFCKHRGIDPDSLAPNVRQGLNDALLRGVGAFWRDASAFLEGLNEFNLDPIPSVVAGTAVTQVADNAAATGQTQLSYQEVVDQYFAEVARSGGVAVKTDADKRAALNLLAEITGGKPVAVINKADAQRTKQVLMQYPRDRHKHRSTKGKPLSDVLDLPDRPKIAAKTMNGYLGNMETFMGWAVRNGHADANHFAGMQVKVQRAKADQRDPFTDAQLGRLFEQLTENSMNLVKTDAAKWGSLVGMFTGMRLNEIAQLETADIKQVDGVWVIDVSDVGEGNRKRLKTAAADRRVPLHDRLIATGFLDFVEAQRDARQERLFPALSFCPKNGYGRAISRWFNNSLLAKLGMKSRTVVFHSFRHTMNTRLRQADVDDGQVKAILGHEQQGMGTGVYFKDGFRLTQLKAAIDRFEF